MRIHILVIIKGSAHRRDGQGLGMQDREAKADKQMSHLR